HRRQAGPALWTQGERDHRSPDPCWDRFGALQTGSVRRPGTGDRFGQWQQRRPVARLRRVHGGCGRRI
ncbi:uncharacterized protein METZ01_LOCUS330237, partial [marine metagenome]